MKKLIYIANARIPTEKAHGIQIMKMCESFGELLARGSVGRGGEIELLVPRRLNPIKQDPFDYYGVRRNFKITRLPTLDLITFGFGSLGFFIETILFLISSTICLLFGKYDILYTREWLAGLFFRNIVLEIHSLPAKPNFFHKKAWRRARALLVLTSFIKNELVKFGVPENKVLVLPDAVDLAKFDIKISKEEARRKLGLPQDKKIILYTGSFYLYDWKGVDILLESAKNFGEDFLFLFVGGSGEEIEQIKSKYNNLSNVLLTEHKPYTEIPYYLKSADVLVLPNKAGHKMSEQHTSPLKLFEYMVSGRPIVASNLPSLREILTEKEAEFFRPNDSMDLTRAIKKVLENVSFAEELSRNALRKAQNYTWAKRARRALDFIVNLAG